MNSVLEKQKADMKALEVHFMDAKQDLERSKSWYLRVVIGSSSYRMFGDGKV